MTKLAQILKEYGVAVAVLAGSLGVFYFGFLNGRCFLWEDLLYMTHPAFSYLATSLDSGRFPLWLSGVRCGIPFFSEPWIYYPPVLALSLWVQNGHLSSLITQWYLVSQLFLGGLFAFLFLRSCRLSLYACITGMVVFVFSAFLSLRIIHSIMGHTFLWLPLELFFVRRIVERRRMGPDIIYLILSIWMSLLAGFPQSVVYNAYFLGAYWLFLVWHRDQACEHETRWWWIGAGFRECAKMVMVFLGVGLLGAFVLLSGLQSWGMSHRQQFGFAQIADLSLPWYYLIHGLAPNFFGVINGDGSGVPFWGFNKDTLEYATWHGGAWMYWEFGFYAGQLALMAIFVLAFNVRRLWSERREMVFFLAVLPVVLWLMLGRYGGLFNIFYHIAPGFSMFRTPARIGCLFDFSAAVLTAVLVDALWKGQPILKLKRPLLALGGIYVVLFFGVLIYGGSIFPELNDPRFLHHALIQVGISAMFFAVMAVLLVWIKRLVERHSAPTPYPSPEGIKTRSCKPNSSPPRRGKGWVSRIAPIGSEGGAGWMARVLVWALIAITFLDLYLAFHKFHQGRTKPEEYYADRNGLMPQMTKLREQQGSFRFAQLRDGKVSEELVFPRNIGYLYPSYEALEGYILFNLKEFTRLNSMTNEQVRLGIQNVGLIANLDSRTRQVGLMRYTNSLPRAKFYHDIRVYDDEKALYADLDSGRLDYHRTLGVLREECVKYGVANSAPPVNAQAQAHFTPVNSDEYQISYQTTAPGIIFISESFYPGWQADGGRYPVIHALGAFKGIVISEAGSGVITVKFSPRILWTGLLVSGTTLCLLLVTLAAIMRRESRKREARGG
ncbi:MAG: hypothetical protein WCO42_10065 [bacterium]